MTTSYLRWDCVRCGRQHTRELRPCEQGGVLLMQMIEHPDNNLEPYWPGPKLLSRGPIAQVFSLSEPNMLNCHAPDVEVVGER